MKIKCRYCDNYMNDTDDVCPSCGAQNADVVRSTKSQPKTIEELKQWYSDRGLPPYETTRFFIGEDYKKPRAFGIYKDSSTGKCVVYKNKDSGQRAVRYEGTDEAYAVNEIFQRLKQEIIEQKMNNVKKAGGGSGSQSRNSSGSGSQSSKGSDSASIIKGILKVIGLICSPIILLFVIAIIIVIVQNKPDQGYYNYEGTPYYYKAADYHSADYNWYRYDEQASWCYPTHISQMPEELHKKKTAKKYYVQFDWDSNLPCTNFEDSVYYADIQKGFKTAPGYYKYNDDDYYYHMGTDYDSGWYYYSDDNDWSSTDSSNIPEDLKHPSMVDDFYYTPTWDASTQISDFFDSAEYSSYQAEQERSYSSSSSSYDNDNDYSWDWDDDDDYDWDYDSGDSWDSGSSDWDSDW